MQVRAVREHAGSAGAGDHGGGRDAAARGRHRQTNENLALRSVSTSSGGDREGGI